MKKSLLLFLFLIGIPVGAQQPQTSTAPIYAVNAKYVQGVGPGYWPTAGAGLTLNLSAGTVWCLGTVRTYAGGTLTMTNSTTNYVYLDPASSCAPTSSTSSFGSSVIPIAAVVASGGAITTITDDRGVLAAFSTSSLSGSVSCGQLPALTGDVTTSAGSCATVLSNIPDGATQAGKIVAAVISAPATPSSSHVSFWFDSTDLRFHDKNASGAIGTTAVAKTSASHKFFSAMSTAGVFTDTQPDFSDLSGSTACSQLPALTGDVTSSAGSCATTNVNAPDGFTQAGKIVAAVISAPSTPAASHVSFWFDSTDKRLHDKNDAGAIGTTSVAKTSASHKFFSAMSAAGVFTDTQPAESDLSVTDITTNNATTSAHGFLPKGDNVTTHWMRGDVSWSSLPTIPRAIPFTIYNSAGLTAATTIGSTDYVTVPFGCTISAYNLTIDAGTITVKFWKKATGTAIPTNSDSISTSGVSISSGTAIHSTTTSDFTTTTVTANDIMAMNITAVTTATFVNGVLQCDESQ